jgi:4-aminobutyrate aminotransferase-like enzyme/aminoglycoside phosphotransferase (APT) family kinase protein
LLALRTSACGVTLREVQQCAREVYGLEGTVSALGGERDRNFRLQSDRGEDWVLKVVDVASDPQTVDCQVRVLRHLAEQAPDLPIPRLRPTRLGAPLGLLAHDGESHATLLIEHLPGRLLGAIGADRERLAALGGSLGSLDRALQGFFHPALAQSLVWDVRRLAELAQFVGYLQDDDARSLVREVVREFAELLPSLRGLSSQAIHGDCHGGNVLFDPTAARVTGIIDFGDMIHAPRIFEPAVAMAELLGEGVAELDELPALLQAYVAVQPLGAPEIECLYGLIRARHAVSLLVHEWRSRHDPAGARALYGAIAHATRSLETLRLRGPRALLPEWHEAAGTLRAETRLARRRARLLGAGAELFYEHPLHIVRGEDVWLFDTAGRRYLDVYNNVPHVGHAHPAVVAAVRAQVGVLATHTRYLHESILDYAEQLTARLPRPLDTCIFVNSGSEANDVAWRIAQQATGRRGALIMEHAYHGITDAVAALTPAAGRGVDPRVVTLATPPAGLRLHQSPDTAVLAAAGADADAALHTLAQRGLGAAAFYLDSAFTSSGIFDPPAAWLAAITTRVRAAGGLVVGDEVQYGLGRSGSHFWGFERRGYVPDIVTLGKPIGNGFPMGVVITRRELVEEFQSSNGFFSTFGGNAVAAEAGRAVLRVLDEQALQANAEITGEYLRARLEALAARHACFGAVRGAGLLLGLEVLAADGAADQPAARRIVNRLAGEHGVLTGLEGPSGHILKLRPPLTFAREHADLLVAALEASAAWSAEADAAARAAPRAP